jgi:hypothetical protein
MARMPKAAIRVLAPGQKTSKVPPDIVQNLEAEVACTAHPYDIPSDGHAGSP